jgi:hypothetical protein
MDTKKMLASVRRRPGMYFGSSDYPFTSLLAFMSGVRIGGGPTLIPDDFDQFVAERLGERWPTGKSPSSFIREHTASEKEAFELFFQLLDEYENKRP